MRRVRNFDWKVTGKETSWKTCVDGGEGNIKMGLLVKGAGGFGWDSCS
jgi:hypothetical protein